MLPVYTSVFAVKVQIIVWGKTSVVTDKLHVASLGIIEFQIRKWTLQILVLHECKSYTSNIGIELYT